MTRFRFGWIAAFLGTTPALFPLPLAAQTPAAQAAQATHRFDITAGSLSSALIAFGRQSGIQVSYPSGLAQGLSSPGVSGTLSADAALHRLLAGTGLTWRYDGVATILLDKAPASAEGALMLDPVTVEGASQTAQETAFGPVKGYVAKRASAGTKGDTALIETPQTISVITRDQMDTRQVNTLNDALQYTAGVVSEVRGTDSRYDWMSIRGFEAGSYLFRDGLNAMGGVDKLEPYALERLEVIKGPASVTYGQMAPGGVVSAVTKRPTQTPLHEIQVLGGSFDQREVRLDVSETLNADKGLAARVTGLMRESSTQVDYTSDDRRMLAASLSWKPDSATSLTLLGQYKQDESDYPSWLPAQGTVQYSSLGKIARDRFTGEPGLHGLPRVHTSLGYEIEHQATDWLKLSQKLRYTMVDTKDFFIVIGGTTVTNGVLSRNTFAGSLQKEDITTDNRAEMTFATGPLHHQAFVGIDYLWDDYSYYYGQGTAPGLNLYNPVYGSTITRPVISGGSAVVTTQTGLYAQDQIKLDDRWIWTLGARQDYVEAQTKLYGASSHSTQHDEAFTWRTGLMYASAVGVSPYVSYATSFVPNSGTKADGSAFVPTTAKQSEIGVKYQPNGYNSFLTASLFDLVQENVKTTDPNNTSFSIQTGEVRSRGLELEGVASLDNGWKALAAVTLMDSEITKSNATDLGNRPTGVPNVMASLWLDYTFEDGMWRGLTLGGGGRYVGETLGQSTTPTFRVSGYTILDAAIRYAVTDSMELSLNGKNLADTEYATCLRSSRCSWGAGRSVVAGIKYRW